MNKRILVVEDDESIKDILYIILQRAGYTANVLLNGNLIMEDNYALPDLFLIDKQLSGIDGIGICQYLKSKDRTNDIPVIMMSAYPNIGELSMAAGADGYIEKPFEVDALLKIIEKHLHNHAEKIPA